MPNFLPTHLRPKREKLFGQPRGVPLDRNAKARIMVAARAYNARFRQPGQHWGPLTRACLQVLEALLWGFHNSKDGRCFPSYERIAERARCNRDTVYEAIKALERADILTWVNRIAHMRVWEPNLFGKLAPRLRVIRTSNAYLFRDPLPCAEGRPAANPAAEGLFSSKSENPSGTPNPDSNIKGNLSTRRLFDLDAPLDRALMRLGVATGAI